jgi:hypothetical protein
MPEQVVSKMWTNASVVRLPGTGCALRGMARPRDTAVHKIDTHVSERRLRGICGCAFPRERAEPAAFGVQALWP